MVAGGAVEQLTIDTATASTEVLKQGASYWMEGIPLPKAQGGLRAASRLDGSGIWLTGIDRSVLWYCDVGEERQWEELGTTKTGFWKHSTVAGDLASLCH